MNGLGTRWGSVRIQMLALAILLGSTALSFAITAEQKTKWQDMSGTIETDAQGKRGLQYDVTTSTVVLTLEKGSHDVRALQDVIYNIWGGKKSAAFRALGNYTIADYTCSDGVGNEFETLIDGEENSSKTLVWFFPEMTKGLQRSVAKFTLKGDLRQNGDLTVVSAPWASAWRTDVHCLRWTVVMPAGVDPDVKSVMPQMTPAKKVFRNGRWTVTQDLTPLKGTAFQLSFASRDMSGAPPAEGTTVAIATPEPCDLSGTVMDIATGKPAAGIHMYKLASMADGGYSDYEMVVTDDNGKFKTKVASGSNVNFRWQNSPDGKYVIDQEWQNQGPNGMVPLQRQSVTKSESNLVLNVKLRAMIPLKGLVTDPQGRPVDGARVYVSSEAGPVTSDREGRFVLPIAPTDHDYDLFVNAPRSSLAGIAHFKAGTQTGTIALEPTRDYKGEVTSEDGLPAAGLRFSLYVMLNGSYVYQEAQLVNTTPTGTFTAAGLYPRASYMLNWSSDNDQNRNYDNVEEQLDLSTIPSGEPIRFKAKMYINALMGQVTNEKKEPLAGATVTVQPPNMMRTGGDPMRQEDRAKMTTKPIVTDKDGRFTIERLAAGEAVLKISAVGCKPKSFLVKTDDVDVAASLDPAGGTNMNGGKPAEAFAR